MPVPSHLRPARFVDILRRRLAEHRYDLGAVQKAERAKFEQAGLDQDAGRARLDALLLELTGRKFDHVHTDDSVHWLLFACLSLTPWAERVRDILEIGTFRGKTTVLLSRLFPRARCVTIDLPEDDPILRSTYGRADPARLAEHRALRDANVAAAGARFVEANSFLLPQAAPGPYDLIWVDGGHLFPEIAWDLCNAWHMCRPGGIVLCDDVLTDPRGGDGTYVNYDSNATISYLAARLPVSPAFFLKRENPTWSAVKARRKYVVMLRKAETPDVLS